MHDRVALASIILVTGGLASAVSSAQVPEQQYTLSIKQQPLGQALQELAKQSGLQIIFFSEVAAGHQGRAVEGRFTAQGALERLIADSSLTYREINSRTIEIRPAAQTNSLQEPGAAPLDLPLDLPPGVRSTSSGAAIVLAQASTPRDAAATLAGSSGADSTSETREAADVGAEGLSEVMVTGSRVIQDGFRAPTPVTVVTADQLMTAAPASLSDALNQLPIFVNSFRPSSTGPGITSNAGGAYLNARSLGANRNLVLLDGRRSVPSSVSGLVAGATDINVFPQLLVQRVDVVTGGASAAYGADAVSGVVNFILDSKFTGLRGDVQGGVSERGDNESLKFGLAFGTPFAEDRGHLLLSGEHYDNAGVADFTEREWAGDGYAVVRTPAPLPQSSTANPTRALLRDVRNSDRNTAGLITNGPLSGNYFNPDGTVSPFPYGTYRTSAHMSGGGTNDDIGRLYSLMPQITRYSLFGRASFDLTDAWTVYTELLHARSESEYNGQYSNQTFTIQADNAFLQPEVRARLGASPSFQLGRINADFGFREEAASNETFRAVAGITGRLGDWQTEVYYSRGESRQNLREGNNVILANIARSVDAVVVPVGAPGGLAAGTTTCRALISPVQSVRDAAAGCVPVNVFGEGSANAAAIDYFTGTNWQRQHIRQDVVDASVTGSPWSSWAGEIAMGAGLSWRKEQVVAQADPIGTARGFENSNLAPLAGEFDVTEVFVEAIVPLASDLRWARALDLNAAVRYADYSTSGGVTSWKAGLTYRPIDDLRLRATRSRDVRAANLNELYSGPVNSRAPLVDPFRGSESNPNVTSTSVGSAALDAEQGDTWTVGFVLEPSRLPGFTASIDYFDIKLTDTIGTLGSQEVINQCFAGAAQLCGLIQRAAPTGDAAFGAITIVTNPYLNVGTARNRGIDFEAAYRVPLGDWAPSLPGALTLRLLSTRMLERATTVAGAATVTDQVGRISGLVGAGGSPAWTGTLNLSYEVGAFSLHLQERYIGRGVIDTTVDGDGNPISATAAVNANLTGNGLVPNRVNDWFYTDLTAKYRFGADQQLETFITVNNLFDKDPAVVPIFFTIGTMTTNPQLYDTIGRTFTLGLRVRL